MKRPVRLEPGQKLVLTANRLLDGRTVWWCADGTWDLHIGCAALLDADEAEALLSRASEQAQRDGVVGVYDTAVQAVVPPEPVTVREKIRAHGPTVHPEFAVETEQ
ncbi:DUF2849 domain-containing protein [Gluconobacter sp. R75690]|uniref:DUF2849 domain-containing protein n=1 Tax=Gluconobacter TaxID=441 RepID=UPI00188C42FE|nr:MULTISPECIES: DUF2849 domain-containing protein [unclassified Gluconobacter]MBF0851240.1 DUF2849 domain-containing protein [Gluconobacter sp. R75690]MBF0879993.1 DUF2849 domain-containing protein [Gluconobacter sp. R75828]